MFHVKRSCCHFYQLWCFTWNIVFCQWPKSSPEGEVPNIYRSVNDLQVTSYFHFCHCFPDLSISTTAARVTKYLQLWICRWHFLICQYFPPQLQLPNIYKPVKNLQRWKVFTAMEKPPKTASIRWQWENLPKLGNFQYFTGSANYSLVTGELAITRKLIFSGNKKSIPW